MSTHAIISELFSQSEDNLSDKTHPTIPNFITSPAPIKDGLHIERGPPEKATSHFGISTIDSSKCFHRSAQTQPSWLKRMSSAEGQSETTWRTILPSRSSQSAKCRWPEPELSIGISCAPLGKNQCWEVIGPAREISSRLFRDVKDLLDQHGEYLHETESVPFSIMFGLYMIGKTEKLSSPTLLLSCEPRKPRHKAIQLVRETGILQMYPGVLLAESSRSPLVAGAVRPLGASGAVDHEFVYFTAPTQDNVCGLPIHLMESLSAEGINSTSISQKATMGGFLRLWNSEHTGLYCGLTVAHAFEDSIELADMTHDIEFSFDGEGIESESESDSETVSGKENAKLRPEWPTRPDYFHDIVNEDQTYINSLSRINQFGIGSLFASSLNGEQPGLDWALVEIDYPHTQQANIISFDGFIASGQCTLFVERLVTTSFVDANVLVVTRRGVQSGKLSGSSSCYKSAHQDSFEEVWTVRLADKIGRGDSGSWVIDPQTGDLYGHIIAGCPESLIGYLIPAKRIFNDIRRQLGGRVELASRNSNTATTANESSLTRSSSGKEKFQKPAPLGTNQTEEELLRYLDMNRGVFKQMEEDAYRLYVKIIFDGTSIKRYTRKLSSHITWNDIDDKAKYEAMMTLSTSGTSETQPYWNLGQSDLGCPNWIARWFLSQQFKKGYRGKEPRHSEITTSDLAFSFSPRESLHLKNQNEHANSGTFTAYATSNYNGSSKRSWRAPAVSKQLPGADVECADEATSVYSLL